MKLLWIGEYTTKTLMNRLMEYGYTPMSISVSQANLIEGIRMRSVIDTLSGCRLPFKKNGKIKFRGESWTEKDGSFHCFVDLITIPYFELLYKTRQMIKEAKKWAESNKREICKIIVYGPHLPYLKCAQVIKDNLPQAEIICIVPDLPQYMDLNMSVLKKILKKIDWLRIKRSLKSVDKFVLYTKHMADFLNIEQDKWMLMEGVFHPNEVLNDTVSGKQKAIMYSGACNLKFGIPLLLEAFSKVECPDCELWISGSGDAVDLIQNYEKKDKRIKYLGYLPSRRDLLLKQKQACALINMRMPDEEASAYCFPSKIIEYMLSENPVLSFRIPGIPEEYYKYLVEIKEPTQTCVADAIQFVLEMSERERETLGKKGRDFVLRTKSNTVQTARILDFIGV